MLALIFTVMLAVVAIGLFIASVFAKKSEDRGFHDTALGLRSASVVFIIGVFVIVAGGGVRIVPAGHVGVQVLFGDVQARPLSEGLHVINPVMSVEKLSVRTSTYTMSATVQEGQIQGDDSINALSSDGLLMPLDVSVMYRVVPDDAPFIFQNFGKSYEDNVIRPASRSAVREATAKFAFQEAYSSRREELETDMEQRLMAKIAEILAEYKGAQVQCFIVQDVMLRNVSLPDKVKEAIERKLEADQEAQRMQFVLQKETQEAERKRIEAQGISDFQRIVTQGISEPLLRWKGIEATEKLAESTNAKLVIVGGKDGLPLILNAP